MLKKRLNKARFRSEIKSFYARNKDEIIDILLFGSAVKGKEEPPDIDILILYKNKENLELNYELKKILEKISSKVQISAQTYNGVFKPSFKAREAFLEAYSLIFDTNISEGLGYLNKVLFKYELKKLSKSDRMRFYHALYGRGNSKGILKELNAVKFAETIVLCPQESSESMKDFFNSWKIHYSNAPILIPKRVLAVFR